MAPAKIVVIRHGEKPKDKSETGLSETGKKRAKMLVDYFRNHIHVFGEICAIYAAAPTSDESSVRAEKTLKHVAKDWNIEINLNYHREKKSDANHFYHGVRTPKESSQTRMAEEILHNHHYHNKTVLICWEHHTIPDLIVSLGGPDISEYGEVYNRTIVLSYDHHSHACIGIEDHTQPTID